MQLYCPNCQAAFPGVNRCPRCGGLLLLPHELAPSAAAVSGPVLQSVQSSGAERLATGWVLGLGVSLAVHEIARGVMLTSGADADGWRPSFAGLAPVHMAQAVAVVFAAMIAAAGRAAGALTGLTVGLACSGSFLGYDLLAGAPTYDPMLYVPLPVLGLMGLAGGVLGTRVWPSAPRSDLLPAAPSSLSHLSSMRFLQEKSGPRPRPTAWTRVLLGGLLMVLGVALADDFRQAAQRYSGGLLRVQSLGQAEYLTWQLAAFVVLFGGMVAGAGTGAGLRHGLLAGLLGGLAVLGLYWQADGTLPPVEWWLACWSLDDLPRGHPVVTLAVVGGVLAGGLTGGWLGGQLVLPLPPRALRQRIRIGD